VKQQDGSATANRSRNACQHSRRTIFWPGTREKKLVSIGVFLNFLITAIVADKYDYKTANTNAEKKWKSAQRRKRCALAVVRRSQKSPPPPQTLFPVAQDGQNLTICRWSLPSPTDRVWWRSMHAFCSYRGNRPTNKHTQPHTHRQDRLQS